jgi:ATP-binding protein involved in chromosome partitioning
MIENMSGFICPDCGKRYDIFGAGGARKRALELEIPFLGEVPITIAIREHGDSGRSEANFDNPQIASQLESICRTLVGNLAAERRAVPPLPTLNVL